MVVLLDPWLGPVIRKYVDSVALRFRIWIAESRKSPLRGRPDSINV
jgi:hypothetical protein